MTIGPRLDLRQSQTLVMTPQLRQAIQLLQYANLEAAQFIEEELLRNPLLDRDDGGDGDGSAAAAGGQDGGRDERREDGRDQRRDDGDGGSAGDGGGPERVFDDSAGLRPRAAETPLDVDFSNVYEAGDGTIAGGPGRAEDDDDATGRIADRPVDLRDHLEQQMRLAFDAPGERAIAAALIAALDAAGRIAEPPETIAAQLGVTLDALEAVRAVMLRFDPTGLFARSLSECLAVQLAERNRLDPAMQTLLGHLDLLAAREHAKLMALCGVDAEDLREMIAELRQLDPKPAVRFDLAPVTPLIPDVLMRVQPDGEFVLELNPETMPRVLIRRGYHAKLAANASRETKQFLAERLQSAHWLTRALEARATTILRVAAEIVRMQDGFFRHGIGHLRPLTLREIAEALEIHESTVSRVTANKAIATPRGVLEMKFFFTTALGGTDGGATHSAEAVRHRIKALIEAEQSSTILSDDAIATMLQKEGIDIARRTVAKYRESLRIPGSAQRRRDKALSA